MEDINQTLEFQEITEVQEWIEQHQVIPPSQWMNVAIKLNILLTKENRNLFTLQNKLAEEKKKPLLDKGVPVNRIQEYMELEPMYWKVREQEVRVNQIREFINLFKKQAGILETEYRF